MNDAVLTYGRGSRDDFDRFANITGDPGWLWDRMLPYFFKNEKWTAPADRHSGVGQYNPAAHGQLGINSTTKDLAEEWPFFLDMNACENLGLQSTIKDGERSSSATSYLGPQYISRPNLHVLLHAQVSRVLQSSSNSRHFNSVEFSQDKKTLHTVTASKEIILSAGSSLGIPSVLDLPSVGQNFSDQPVTSNSWFANSTDTLDTYTLNATRFEEALTQWNDTRTGPLVDTFATHIAWLRPDPNSTTFETFKDPSSGPKAPHIELSLNPSAGKLDFVPTGGNFFSSTTAIVSPVSRGSVTLNSSDPNPFSAPLIDPALFASEFDLFAMRTAIRKSQQFLSAPAWKDYIIGFVDELARAFASDATLDAYIRNTSLPALHCVGSAAMSAKSASWGARGLRVVDASVMAPTYAVAERGSDLIKATWAQSL
ncbi:aryl-alcohol oxidase-like protein [Mycena leptocephala]|nr:aryl-alcohol oxidase-like protein [Mycena leptocephala]